MGRGLRRFGAKCALSLVIASCARESTLPAPTPAPPPPAVARHRAALPRARCARCHGGGSGAEDLREARARGEPLRRPPAIVHAPDYTRDSGPVDGPHWWFETPRSPALSRDGKRVMLFASDLLLGAPPNLDLMVERLSDRLLLSRTPLLDPRAYADAHAKETTLEGRQRAYAALRAKVETEVVALNQRLSAEGWAPLTPCSVDIGAGETQPACTMTD